MTAKLGNADLRFLYHLKVLAEDGIVKLTNQEIGKKTNYSAISVQTRIRALRKAGLLVRRRVGAQAWETVFLRRE